MTKNILFDSFAILKYYQDETGAEKVENLLRSAQRDLLKAFMIEINLGEVYYLTIRRIGLEPAKENLERLLNLPIIIISPSSELIMRAAEIKAQYAISYADCFAVATAEQLSASIITGDPEFKKVEHLVSVDWI
ncbi:MAG: type II toxin-antitoxin system VapC family toxin [Desulfobacterales bacterium]